MDKPRVTVIGAGVIGLSTAVCLLDNGYDVTVFTKDEHPAITSSVAAAIWFPYEAAPEEKVNEWGIRTFEVYGPLSDDADTGVSIIECRWVSDHNFVQPRWSLKVGSYELLPRSSLPDGYTHGFTVRVPLIETPVYMPYLQRRFAKEGGMTRIVANGVRSFDDGELDSIVVNCSGIGAAELANDPHVFPIRGQVVSVSNPGITYAICDDESASAVCYVIPRRDDCILGGTAGRNDWSTETDESVSAEIIDRCRVLEPRLKNSEVLDSNTGLRPGRHEVRLELERLQSGKHVIHNYGHGGAGFTLAWGCAYEVLEMVRSLK